MSKSQKYIELVDELRTMACQPVVLIDEAAVDGEVVQMMRELRQFIERFRRLLEGGDAPVKFLKREDVAVLAVTNWLLSSIASGIGIMRMNALQKDATTISVTTVKMSRNGRMKNWPMAI